MAGASGGAGGASSTGGSAGRGGSTGSGGMGGASGGAGGTSSSGGNSGGKTGGAGGGIGGAAGGVSGGAGGTVSTGGSTGMGGAAGSAGGSGGGTGGNFSANYYGYLPVPNSQNTANANPKTWWTTWKDKYYQDCTNGTGRIASNGNETVSEGIGYGMLMAVGNDDQPTFDKLWAYYKAHEDKNGLMNWKINACDSGFTGQYAATDADEDAAMALVQADANWGGYKTDATTLIGAIKKFETAAGPPSNLLPGDAPGGWSAGTVNPSYFALGYWHVWATYVGDTFWNTLATDAYTALAAYQKLSISGSTGALVPNWGIISGTATDASYGYDACRTPWRITTDYVWFETAEAKTFLQNVSTYIDSMNGVAKAPFDKNSAFIGAFALSGMAVSQAKADQYLNDWLSATVDDTPYFQGALKGVYLLLANQKFPRGN
jgi:endo-1,4-beta-D-glucanase Y